MCKLMIFAGTKEGHSLYRFCLEQKIPAVFYTATAYGAEILEKDTILSIRTGRLDREEICAEIAKNKPAFVIDATHPHAEEITKNIQYACQKQAVSCLRVIREKELTVEESEHVVFVKSAKEAADYLAGTKGNILLSTGSKELAVFSESKCLKNRLYVRILPDGERLSEIKELGIPASHIAAIQGPFCEEFNYAMLKQWEITYLVTKESGAAGGFSEKLKGAKRAGAVCLVIKRPTKEQGYSLEEVKDFLSERFGKKKKQVWILGAGMGNDSTLTMEAMQVLEGAELIIGAKRLLTGLSKRIHQERITACDSQKMAELIVESKKSEIAVLMSGDSGFYSGTQKLLPLLPFDCQVKVLPGISSLSYLAAKTGISWEDAFFVSLHGRRANLMQAIASHRKVFVLTQGNSEEILDTLLLSGMGEYEVILGLNLSSEREQLLQGTVIKVKEALQKRKKDDVTKDVKERELSALFLLNKEAGLFPVSPAGLPEDWFKRGAVPMTKSEVRAVSLSKLQIGEDAVLYDVGAGSGSVSVEMALAACRGRVYAIEKKAEALALIEENKKRFFLENLELIEGSAPACFSHLPAPAAAFIGGSSGKIQEILEALLEKNNRIRIVMNLISLDSLTKALSWLEAYQKKGNAGTLEIVQINVAKAEAAGRNLLMKGQNPVYVVSFQAKEEKD